LSKLEIRPTTIACIVVAAVCVIVAVVYFSTTADGLPSFFPGHEAGSTHHHIKHGIAFLGLGALALVGAWFTTAPAKPD
jgi:amino acid permease